MKNNKKLIKRISVLAVSCLTCTGVLATTINNDVQAATTRLYGVQQVVSDLKNGEEFNILEIVPDLSMASLGLYGNGSDVIIDSKYLESASSMTERQKAAEDYIASVNGGDLSISLDSYKEQLYIAGDDTSTWQVIDKFSSGLTEERTGYYAPASTVGLNYGNYFESPKVSLVLQLVDENDELVDLNSASYKVGDTVYFRLSVGSGRSPLKDESSDEEDSASEDESSEDELPVVVELNRLANDTFTYIPDTENSSVTWDADNQTLSIPNIVGLNTTYYNFSFVLSDADAGKEISLIAGAKSMDDNDPGSYFSNSLSMTLTNNTYEESKDVVTPHELKVSRTIDTATGSIEVSLSADANVTGVGFTVNAGDGAIATVTPTFKENEDGTYGTTFNYTSSSKTESTEEDGTVVVTYALDSMTISADTDTVMSSDEDSITVTASTKETETSTVTAYGTNSVTSTAEENPFNEADYLYSEDEIGQYVWIDSTTSSTAADSTETSDYTIRTCNVQIGKIYYQTTCTANNMFATQVLDLVEKTKAQDNDNKAIQNIHVYTYTPTELEEALINNTIALSSMDLVYVSNSSLADTSSLTGVSTYGKTNDISWSTAFNIYEYVLNTNLPVIVDHSIMNDTTADGRTADIAKITYDDTSDGINVLRLAYLLRQYTIDGKKQVSDDSSSIEWTSELAETIVGTESIDYGTYGRLGDCVYINEDSNTSNKNIVKTVIDDIKNPIFSYDSSSNAAGEDILNGMTNLVEEICNDNFYNNSNGDTYTEEYSVDGDTEYVKVTPATIIKYLLNYNDRRVTLYKDTIKVLDIEPTKYSQLSEDDIRQWLGIDESYVVTVVSKSDTITYDSNSFTISGSSSDNSSTWESSNDNYATITTNSSKTSAVLVPTGSTGTDTVTITHTYQKYGHYSGETWYDADVPGSGSGNGQSGYPRYKPQKNALLSNFFGGGPGEGGGSPQPSNGYYDFTESITFSISQNSASDSHIQSIEIEQMTSSEFIGKLDDLIENYDMIYIGDCIGPESTTGSLYQSNGKTIYNDSSMDGLIYTHVGDQVTVPKSLAGLLTREYSSTTSTGRTCTGSSNDSLDLHKSGNSYYVTSYYTHGGDYGHPQTITSSDESVVSIGQKGNYWFYINVNGAGTATITRTYYISHKEYGHFSSYVWYEKRTETITITVTDNYVSTDHGSPNYVITRYSGNDITEDKYEELTTYAEAGYPVVIASTFFNAAGTEINTSYIDNSSYLYKFMNESIKGTDERSNPLRNVMQESSSGTISALVKYINMPRLNMVMIDWPEDYSCSTDSSGNITDTTWLQQTNNKNVLNYEFEFSNTAESAAGTNTYSVNLYIDVNTDGQYTADEVLDALDVTDESTNKSVKANELKSGTRYKVSKVLPDNYIGLLPWKLEISLNSTTGVTTVHSSEIRYTAVKPQSTTTIKVLQVAPSGYSCMGKLTEDASFKNMIQSVKTKLYYDIQIDYVTTSQFISKANGYLSGDKFYDEYLKNYDMLIFGFSDMYSDISTQVGIDGIQAFIDTGKPTMFAHDTTSFDNGYFSSAENATSTYHTSGWSTMINKFLRSSAGMDRYGITLPSLEELQTYSKNYTISDKLKASIEDEGKDIASKPVTNNDSTNTYYEAQGFSNSFLECYRAKVSSNQSKQNAFYGGQDQATSYITQVNEGQITTYPYNVNLTEETDDGESYSYTRDTVSGHSDYYQKNLVKMSIENTHFQYYQLDYNYDVNDDGQNDLVVWYALAGNSYDKSPNDVRNNYYIYSVGNIIYTGMGHSYVSNGTKAVSKQEAQLFINTIIAAYNSSAKNSNLNIIQDVDSKNTVIDSIYVSYDDGKVNVPAETNEDGETTTSEQTLYDGMIETTDQTFAYYVSDSNIVRGTKTIYISYFEEITESEYNEALVSANQDLDMMEGSGYYTTIDDDGKTVYLRRYSADELASVISGTVPSSNPFVVTNGEAQSITILKSWIESNMKSSSDTLRFWIGTQTYIDYTATKREDEYTTMVFDSVTFKTRTLTDLD